MSLVALSFRDSGFRALPGWIRPFQQEFGGLINHQGSIGTGGHVQVLQINLEDKTWLKVGGCGAMACIMRKERKGRFAVIAVRASWVGRSIERKTIETTDPVRMAPYTTTTTTTINNNT